MTPPKERHLADCEAAGVADPPQSQGPFNVSCKALERSPSLPLADLTGFKLFLCAQCSKPVSSPYFTHLLRYYRSCPGRDFKKCEICYFHYPNTPFPQ